ncbi:MAG: 4Fe-4S binding protein [Thiobacillus sp.]|nr:4Fe-4S binding protein [Thiobacillus sp.]
MTQGVHPVASAEVWRTLLHQPSGLRFEADLCLPMRYRGAGCAACAACAEVCPAEAMGLAEITLDVSDACTGCGRCVAVCPMGALAIDGFSDVGAAQDEPGPQPVECWRVPARDRARGAAAVPCLGGIDAAWLIERHRTSGDGPVLMDRGWCAACPSGGGEQPAAAAVAQARGLLETMGVPPSRLPRIRTAALPPAVAPQADAHADSEIRISRRAFFGRLTRGAGEAVSSLLPAQAAAINPRLARPPRRSRARSRLLAACIELSRARGLPMSYALFRRASASASCCSRGVCAAVCPTGALFTRAPDETAQERVFSAADCIACGACVSACPESASQLDERMDEGWRSEAVLWRLAVRECGECGASFTTAREAETLCDPCNTSRHLARDMFRQFFPRPQTGEAASDGNHEHVTTQGG